MITNQAFLFSIFVLNGLLIGLLFDCFRILRISFKTKDFVTYIEDIIFWILTGIIILYSIFVFNNGEIRFYIFLGIAIGIMFYITLFSAHVIKTSVMIISFVKKIFGGILKILSIPFTFIGKMLKKLFFKPISFITINIKKKISKTIKKIKIPKITRQKMQKL